MLLSGSVADEWDLEVGDVVAIEYRILRTGKGRDEYVVTWVAAKITCRQPGEWPSRIS